jgi:PKD repeat protein
LAGIVATGLVIGSVAIPVALGGQAKADTSPPSTLYVNHSSGACSDQGTGTQAVPFCTIQAAANVVNPGQAVDILPGPAYTQPVTITRSGTLTAPITFTFEGLGNVKPALYPGQGTGGPVLTIKGAHDVTVSGLDVYHVGTDGIDVIGSSDIWLDRLAITSAGDSNASTGISIDGTSSDVTVSRTRFAATAQYQLLAHAGAQRVTVTTNFINTSGAPGIMLDGVTDAVVTGNTVIAGCQNALTLADGTSAVVENNVLEAATLATCTTSWAGLVVDARSATSAGGVTADYNAILGQAPDSEYSWAGTSYPTAAAFRAGVPGQGAHDLDLLPSFAANWDTSPIADSADCSAPGEFSRFSTDFYGRPRDVIDPLATDASYGNGTCHADRGAVELQDTFTFADSVTPSTLKLAAGQPATVTLTSGDATSGWGEPASYTVDFGDGSGPVPVTVGGTPASHVYSTPGQYAITLTATDASGSAVSSQKVISVYTVQAPPVSLAATASRGGFGIWPDMATFTFTGSAGQYGWEIASAKLAFGDGVTYPMALSRGLTTTYIYGYGGPGTYTATLTVTDELGRTSTATTLVTVGDEILPKAPQRAYAHIVPAHSVVRLASGQLHLMQGGESAALVTVTVASPQKAGYVTVYPDGTPRPDRAAVQFAAGQAASNVTLASLGLTNNVDFYNGSSGPINLVITTIGAEETSTPIGPGLGDTYAPVSPAQVLPRTAIAGNRHVAFAVAGHDGVPSGADAVVLDVTSSSGTAAGHFVTYPEKSPSSQMQGAYWVKGQAATGIAVVPLDGGRVALANVGSGTADFTADVVGYDLFPASSTGSVFLPATPARLLKVTLAGKHSVKLQVAGKDGVPATDTTAAMVNLTATGATANGALTAYADGTTRPASLISLSYAKGETVANADIVEAGSDGAIDLYNGGSKPVTVTVDLGGSYYNYP